MIDLVSGLSPSCHPEVPALSINQLLDAEFKRIPWARGERHIFPRQTISTFIKTKKSVPEDTDSNVAFAIRFYANVKRF